MPRSCPFFVRMPVALCMALLCMLAVAAPGSETGAEPAREIRDLYYGDALFEFYQDQYFSTLTGLMVSQHFGRVAHHAEEAEMLRGGILLSYGLHRQAAALFERLIDSGAAPATRDRAWYYLAKIRYQRDYYPEAEQALKHIGTALPPQLQEERALLEANLLMARGAWQQAVTVLEALQDSSSDYVHYNLGIALIKSGNTARGTALLDALGVAHEDDEEHRTLRDRANLALGFAALAAGQPSDQYFERIRLKSAQAGKALLGMGWSHVAAKEYRQALVPWQELAARDDNDTAALEARLAVPYAYAELGALGQSSRLYGDALAAFDREDQALTESIDAIQSGKLVDALLAENPGADMGWFWSIRSLPSMPHASHLAHVLAQHEFQEAFKNYRDLRFLTLNLEQWQAKLAIFEDMLDNRRSAYAARLPAITQQAGTVSVDAMQARRAELARQVAAADDSGTAYASARQQELLAKSSAAQQLIDRHPDDAEFSAAQQRVRLAQGTLLWQLAQDYPQRDWQAHRNLQSIAAMLDQARLLETALQQARHDEPARFDQFAQRIAALAEALNATLPRVAALTAEQQQAVQQIAVAELSHEKELLGQYATQAHFALAQLYDRLSEATTTPAAEADHARTP